MISQISDLSRLASQYGIGLIMALIMAVLFYIVLKWVMKFMDLLTQKAEVREKELHNIIREQTKVLECHTVNAKEFQQEMKTSMEFNREDHKSLSNILNNIALTIAGIKPEK